MTQNTVCVPTPVTDLRLVQNAPHTAMHHLMLLAQGVMNVIPHQPFTVCGSIFGNKHDRLPEHTAPCIALPSPALTTTVGPASPRVAEFEE